MKISTPLACILATAAALALPAHGQGKSCSRADAQAAEKAIERVVLWSQLYKTWQDYAHCSTGLLEENFTDAVLRLAVEWKDVHIVAADVQKSPEYKKFLHTHLTSLMAMNDRPSVHSRATQSCPPKLDAFCTELAEVVKP